MQRKVFNQYDHHFEFVKNEDGVCERVFVMPNDAWERYMRNDYTVKQCAKDVGICTGAVAATIAVFYLLLSGLACATWGFRHKENPFGLKGPFME